MTYEFIVLTKANGVATLALNRPERRNGLTREMLHEVNNALEQIAVDPDIRVLILTGTGKDFSVGADIDHYAGDDGKRFQRQRNWREFRASRLLREMGVVSIAAIRGACAGASFSMACGCDFRILSKTARFNTAFLDVGLAGDLGGPWLLSRIIGPSKARELYFFPGKFDAAAAASFGLATELVEDDALEAAVTARANRLAAAAPLALRTIKENFAAAETLTFAQYVELEAERHIALIKTADASEAFRAFIEKRAPKFEGR